MWVVCHRALVLRKRRDWPFLLPAVEVQLEVSNVDALVKNKLERSGARGNSLNQGAQNLGGSWRQGVDQSIRGAWPAWLSRCA